MAARATLALKPGVWFRRGRLLIVSPDSLGTACPLSGRNSTYRLVQFLEAGSKPLNLPGSKSHRLAPFRPLQISIDNLVTVAGLPAFGSNRNVIVVRSSLSVLHQLIPNRLRAHRLAFAREGIEQIWMSKSMLTQ